jgi:hypothetical protein
MCIRIEMMVKCHMVMIKTLHFLINHYKFLLFSLSPYICMIHVFLNLVARESLYMDLQMNIRIGYGPCIGQKQSFSFLELKFLEWKVLPKEINHIGFRTLRFRSSRML